MKSILGGLIASVLMVTAVQAGPLQVTLETWEILTETTEDGRLVETRVAPDTVVPQDRVEVVADLANAGEQTLTSVSFVLDINPALVIDVDSIHSGIPIAYSFSTHQDPRSFDAFGALTVLAEDGSERPARAEDLGAIKVDIMEFGAAKKARVGYVATVR